MSASGNPSVTHGISQRAFGKYDVHFGVADYKIIDAILNEHFRDSGEWVLILDRQLMYVDHPCLVFSRCASSYK